MSAEDLLRWGYEEYGDKLCLTCSWQKQSSVLVHMVSELGLRIPVIELDTQLFFRESYETRDRLVERRRVAAGIRDIAIQNQKCVFIVVQAESVVVQCSRAAAL